MVVCVVVDVPFPAVLDAGCLPFAAAFEAAGVGSEGVCKGVVMYGGLGMLSGFSSWICIEIISSSCFSRGDQHIQVRRRGEK